MENEVTYQKALAEGIIQEGHYFLVKYPSGKDKLFRLVKRENRYVMWGPPTEGEICLEGKGGYDNLFDLADAKAMEEFSQSDVFEEVHACGLPHKDYTITSYEEYNKLLKDVEADFKHPDDANLYYILATHLISNIISSPGFFAFIVHKGNLFVIYMYSKGFSTGPDNFLVRPEAIPKSTLRISMGGDGSKERPWICIGSEEEKPTREKEKQEESPQERKKQEEAIRGEEVQEEKATEGCITGKGKENVSKDELLHLIQEGEAWLAKLKKYVSKLE